MWLHLNLEAGLYLYFMFKKSWPIVNGKLLYRMSQAFLDIQYLESGEQQQAYH